MRDSVHDLPFVDNQEKQRTNKSQEMSKRVPQFVLLALVTSVAFGAGADGVRFPPQQYIDNEICADCHGSAYDTWLDTKHAASEDTSRHPNAKKFAEELGMRSSQIKRTDSICAGCHFTPAVRAGRERIIAGVSCQSCHGAAADWVAIHDDFGEPGKTRRTETASHQEVRYQRVHSAGMVYPKDLYGLATNCIQCHFVTNQEVVNGSSHPIGSDFDLVTRSQSNIKHFPRADSAKKIKMAIAGIAASCVQSFKALATAEPDTRFGDAMRRKAQVVSWQLITMSERIAIVELGQIAQVLRAADIRPGNLQLERDSARIDEIARLLVGVNGSVTRSTQMASETIPEPAPDRFR